MKKTLLSLALALVLALTCFPCLSLAEEVPTLKVLAVLDSRTPEVGEFPNYKAIEEAAGVKIEWEYILSSAWDEQKTLVLSTGDLPDIFLGAKAMTTSDIYTNVEYFLPLEDLIAEYGPHIQAMWEEVPATKTANTYPDGHIYSIGHVMSHRPATEAALYINKVWLDNLGLEVPTTVEELTEALLAFRDQDANGNGDPSDEIPMIGRKLEGKYGPAAMRGYFQADNCIEYEMGVDEDGKVYYVPVTENYKAWVEWVHMLIQENLLNSDVVTIDSTRYKALQANEEIALCGVITGWTQGNAGRWADQYVPLDIAEGPFGKAYVAANAPLMRSGISGWSVVSVTQGCAHPEAAVRWIDLFYEPVNSLQAYWGPLGVSIELKEDGMYDFIFDEERDAELGYHTYDNWYYAMGDGGLGFISEEIDAQMVVSPTDRDKSIIDALYADNLRPESFIYPPVILERMQNDEVIQIKTDMRKMTREMTAKWVMEGGIEEEWDKYVSEMQKMGLDRYLEIYQSKLEELR